MGVVCLFETPAGFALFNVHDEGVLEDVNVRRTLLARHTCEAWHHVTAAALRLLGTLYAPARARGPAACARRDVAPPCHARGRAETAGGGASGA